MPNSEKSAENAHPPYNNIAKYDIIIVYDIIQDIMEVELWAKS